MKDIRLLLCILDTVEVRCGRLGDDADSRFPHLVVFEAPPSYGDQDRFIPEKLGDDISQATGGTLDNRWIATIHQHVGYHLTSYRFDSIRLCTCIYIIDASFNISLIFINNKGVSQNGGRVTPIPIIASNCISIISKGLFILDHIGLSHPVTICLVEPRNIVANFRTPCLIL